MGKVSARLAVEMFFGLSIFGVYAQTALFTERESVASLRYLVSIRSFYDSPPGSAPQVSPWLFFSVSRRQFDLAVLNIV